MPLLMNIKITVEVAGGTSIESAAIEAQDIADRLNAPVEFEFNSVKCIAKPGGSADILANRQQRLQNQGLRCSSDPAEK